MHGRLCHGIDDLFIAGASADVPPQRVGNLLPGRTWIVIEQSFRGHEEPRRAITALNGAMPHEGLLQGVELAILLEPFYGENDGGVELSGQCQTGGDRLSIS